MKMNKYEKWLTVMAVGLVFLVIFVVYAAFFSDAAERRYACIDEEIQNGRELETAEYICNRRSNGNR